MGLILEKAVNSVKIIESIAEKNPAVKFYKNDKNQGVWHSCNKATQLACFTKIVGEPLL